MHEAVKKHLKIGLDLDGVLIDKPPLVPKQLLEWLVRSHKEKELTYRFPKTKLEQKFRWLTHHPNFRPPIRENIKIFKKLINDSNLKFYIVSSRYDFLKSRTSQWFKKWMPTEKFVGVCLNIQNQQPHVFKEKKIKELEIDIYIDDDLSLCCYLAKKISKTRIYCFNSKRQKNINSKVILISSLKEIVFS